MSFTPDEVFRVVNYDTGSRRKMGFRVVYELGDDTSSIRVMTRREIFTLLTGHLCVSFRDEGVGNPLCDILSPLNVLRAVGFVGWSH